MLEKLKNGIIIFVLLVDMRVFHTLMAPSGETLDAANTNPQSSPVVLTIILLAQFLMFILILLDLKKVIRIFIQNILILATLFIVVFSVFWSVDGGFSLRRVILLLVSTATGVYIGQRYQVDGIQRIF